jgi:hypothetical protein
MDDIAAIVESWNSDDGGKQIVGDILFDAKKDGVEGKAFILTDHEQAIICLRMHVAMRLAERSSRLENAYWQVVKPGQIWRYGEIEIRKARYLP